MANRRTVTSIPGRLRSRGRMSEETVKYQLPESEIPTHWVNLLPDLPGDPMPPLNPGTMQPAGPEDLTPIFPMGLIQQEVSMDPEVEIPEPVREVYKWWRPSPLYRARAFERELGTPAHIYYKYEGVSPAGSHKPNSAVAQADENKQAGRERVATVAGVRPAWVFDSVGGASNFDGISFPFERRNLRGEASTRFVAAEPAACPTLTRGAYRYDFGDTVGMTPLLPMYTLGHDFVPPPVHAGGLRYHGDSPIVCGLVKNGVIEPRAYYQNESFEAAVRFARTEGILPGPEPAHAIRAVVEEADAAKEAGEQRVILFNLSGHGHFDMSAYEDYLSGKLEDVEFSEQEMEEALARLPEAPAIA